MVPEVTADAPVLCDSVVTAMVDPVVVTPNVAG